MFEVTFNRSLAYKAVFFHPDMYLLQLFFLSMLHRRDLDQGMCWNEDMNDERDEGWVVDCGNGLFRARTVYSGS